MPIDLSQAERVRRSRFVLRSLFYFWPIVDSPDDVDRVTRLAYSICLWGPADQHRHPRAGPAPS